MEFKCIRFHSAVCAQFLNRACYPMKRAAAVWQQRLATSWCKLSSCLDFPLRQPVRVSDLVPARLCPPRKCTEFLLCGCQQCFIELYTYHSTLAATVLFRLRLCIYFVQVLCVVVCVARSKVVNCCVPPKPGWKTCSWMQILSIRVFIFWLFLVPC